MKPHQSGFSLLEMLVGLALLGLISVAVTQSVRTGLRLWQAAEANDTEVEWQQTEWLIEQWMARALSPKEFDVDSRVVFEARPTGLSFLVDGQVGRKPAGYSRISLDARDNPVCPGRSDFVLAWEDVSLAANFASGARDERVLFECVDAIEFNYPATPASSVNSAPYQAYDQAADLPRIVQIRLTAGGKPRVMSARLRYAR